MYALPGLMVIEKSRSGRNTLFLDTLTGEILHASVVVQRIKNGAYPRCHLRLINGIETPVTNPDGIEWGNLG